MQVWEGGADFLKVPCDMSYGRLKDWVGSEGTQKDAKSLRGAPPGPPICVPLRKLADRCHSQTDADSRTRSSRHVPIRCGRPQIREERKQPGTGPGLFRFGEAEGCLLTHMESGCLRLLQLRSDLVHKLPLRSETACRLRVQERGIIRGACFSVKLLALLLENSIGRIEFRTGHRREDRRFRSSPVRR